MRLLHYPGRQNIKYYGAQTLGFLLFMTVCLGCRIITNELWADKTNNLLSTRLFPMADIKWPICDILLSKKSSQQPLRCVSDYLCVQCSLSVRVFVNVDANLYPIPPQRRVPWTLWFVSPQVILCHLCVRYLPPPPLPHIRPPFNPIVNPFSYVTAATDLQTIDTIAPQNCQIENNLFRWPVDKKYGWSATLLHQHKYSGNPRVHFNRKPESNCVFKRFMGEKTRWKQDIGNDFRILHWKPLFNPQHHS